MKKISSFRGVIPRLDTELLPNECAQVALDCRIESGTLTPWMSPLQIATPTKSGTIASIYRWGQSAPEAQYWFNWLNDTDCVRGPISGDTAERTYFTESGQPPRVTRSDLATGSDLPNAFRLLGVPAPDITGVTTTVTTRGVTSASCSGTTATLTVPDAIEYAIGSTMSVVVSGVSVAGYNGSYAATVTGTYTFTYTVSSTLGAGTGGSYIYQGSYQTRVYVLTFVSDMSEESGPSNPITVTVPPGGFVSFSSLPTTATWSDRTGSTVLSLKRLYRSTGSGSALEKEMAVATGSYVSSASSITSQTILPSVAYLPPPADMKALALMPSGVMLGASGQDLCASERFKPHAYPTQYRNTLDYPIVGIAAFGQGAVVFTTAKPYLVIGTDPSALTVTKLDNGHGCVSKRSITGGSSGAYCAATDGIAFVSSNGPPQIITEKLFSRAEWSALKPSSILGVFWDNKYFGFYDNGTTQGCFILDVAIGELTFGSTFATAAWVDPITDQLYLVVGGKIVRWNGGATPIQYTWRGPEMRTEPKCFAFGKVSADSYPVTFKLYTDGVLKFTKSVTSKDAFRLPSGYLAELHSMSITASTGVSNMWLLDDLRELHQ